MAQRGGPESEVAVVLVLEASDAVGGRVRTDLVDGFRLDRGFQVLLTAYPTARDELDYAGLALEPFYPGALIQIGSRRYRFADPWKKPFAALGSILAPVASLADGPRMARMRSSILSKEHPRRDDAAPTTLAYLQERGLSSGLIERFLRPFFGGVFLERPLDTPSWFFEFVFAMFARGHAALPRKGMGAIPEQMAAALPEGTVRTGTPVERIEKNAVHTKDGERIEASQVVLAVDADAARKLLPDLPSVEWNATTTVYYAAPRSPIGENILLLRGEGQGIVNHVCVPSDLSSDYAPEGSALVSVSLLGTHDPDDEALDKTVRGELGAWCGREEVDAWRFLRAYRIPHALPRLGGGGTGDAARSSDMAIVCGDHLTDPSIDGALRSGRAAADAVLASRG